MKLFLFIVIAAMTTTWCAATAQGESSPAGADQAGQQFTFSLYMDNDGVYFRPGNHSDRYYTHGTKMTITHHPQWADDAAEAIGEWIPIGSGDKPRTAVGYTAGQLLFTAQDTTVAAAQPQDRPYAGWLFGGMYFQRAAGDREFDHFELDLGVVGPSALGRQAQTFIHDLFGSEDPQGWDHQLHDQFGINFIYQRKWKFDLYRQNDGTFAVQMIPQTGLTLGNVNRQFNGDMTFRAGVNLPDDFGPGRLEDVTAATGSTTAPWGIYGFVRVAGRYVEHDLFLQGDIDRDGVGVSIKPWVGELQFGAACYWHKLALSWSDRWVTEQFRGQHGTHTYGSWMLSYTTTF